MKRKIIPVLIGCTLSFSALAAQPTAERYVVSFPEGTHVNYAGAFASAFPNGLPVGIGSGLLFTGKQGDALTYSAAIFLIPICISFDTAEKRRYATYLILNRRFSFEF